MKYVVTALLAIVCIAGVCRWIAERVADRRHCGPDQDRRLRPRKCIEQQQDEFVGRRSDRPEERQHALWGPQRQLAPRQLQLSRTIRSTDAPSH
jgi:hypothetical protein